VNQDNPLQNPFLANGRERGIYLTFGDASVINSTCKAYLRHQMCPKRLTEPGKTKLPLGRAQGICGA
jgi:hypothetical protein